MIQLQYVEFFTDRNSCVEKLNRLENGFRQARIDLFSDDKYSIITILPHQVHEDYPAKVDVVLALYLDKLTIEDVNEIVWGKHKAVEIEKYTCGCGCADFEQVGDCPAGAWRTVCCRCGKKKYTQ